jgi:putative membrane protein
MNKWIVSSACAALMLSSFAFAQSVGEKTGVNSTLGISPSTQDFVTEAANSDILELAAAKVADSKGNADEKKFAEQMTTDHTNTSKDLKALIDSGDVKATIPVKLNSTGQKQLDELIDAKPDDFAGYYDPMQVSAHKDAVSLFERYAKSGENPKLKDWAGKTLPALQHHLEMAEALNQNRVQHEAAASRAR